ncbi:hypothetical protein MANES_04G124400v8 [Manihot esculenta]|uniref:Uncharacterized protein n=1 Tax=Manihot esculenta TaxID=3983 RepID=A0ACB7HUK4_MANES|nr:hypothetical protein MANES_04G124400v8 [Manihot esculenta]
MLDGLLKSKFYTKCKSLLKMSKARLELLNKKKSSVAKFLKNDMADLLKNGLDYNAYCRADGLLVEQKMIASYNFIEQFCGCISTNLSAMSKHKEAVQSLIYAAARIAEFPELRDFRTLFTERYGHPNESLVNKEFVETLRPKHIPKETKLQLLHDIAEEFNIEWNSKSLEQKLFKPPQEDQNRHCPKSKDDVISKGDCKGDDEDGNKLKKHKDDHVTERTSPEAGNKVNEKGDDTLHKKEKTESASSGRKNAIYEGYNLPCSSEDEVISLHRRSSSDLDRQQATSSSVGSVSEDEADRKKPFYYRFIPPPYLKPKVVKEEVKIEEPPKPTGNVLADDSVSEAKPKPRSVRRIPSKPPPGDASFGSDARPLKPPPGRETIGSVELPLKPPPGREKVVRFENGGSDKSNSVAAKEADDVDEGDEEKKTTDGHLMHYSKDRGKPNQKPSPSWRSSDDTKLRHTKSGELPPPPGREAGESGLKKGATRHIRAVSLQSEIEHVHPKLPDYEDLAARFAALKGVR